MPAADETPLSLPSPQIFSLLPSVHALLLRLQASTSSENDSASTHEVHALDSQQNAQPLSLKDLPSAVAPIRLQIAKAKAVAETLPDVERTVEEQEMEIRELEERIAGLKKMLGRLGEQNTWVGAISR